MKQQTTAYSACINTPFARLGLRFDGEALSSIEFIESSVECDRSSVHADLACQMLACQQIKDYCENKLPGMMFNLPVRMQGTVFQKKVWQLLQGIPAGELVTYGELAKQLNSSARAVGNACRCNPVPVVVPCHRVVAKNHSGGYSGETSGRMLDIKNWLIEHERVLNT